MKAFLFVFIEMACACGFIVSHYFHMPDWLAIACACCAVVFGLLGLAEIVKLYIRSKRRGE